MTDVPIFVRAPKELAARLQAQAAREDRSVASLVRRIIESYLDREEAAL